MKDKFENLEHINCELVQEGQDMKSECFCPSFSFTFSFRICGFLLNWVWLQLKKILSIRNDDG